MRHPEYLLALLPIIALGAPVLWRVFMRFWNAGGPDDRAR